jgi:TolA-binding protein
MSDTPETRSRSARTAVVALLIFAAIAVGATVAWQKYGFSAEPTTASVQLAVQSRPLPGTNSSDETKQALNALEQTVKDIQASQQQMADHLSETKQQLAAEQGERKMLSEQVGALAGRLDSLAAASASSVTPGTAGGAAAQKRR